jgi:hypothetical protein
MAAIEDLSDAELKALQREFERLAKEAGDEAAVGEGAAKTAVPEKPEQH